MISTELRRTIASLIGAVESAPEVMPLSEIAAIRHLGFDVDVDLTGGGTVVFTTPRIGVRFDVLTDRELEVATLVAGGYSNSQIATALFISLATVKDHVHAIYRKVGVGSRSQMIAAWYGGDS